MGITDIQECWTDRRFLRS